MACLTEDGGKLVHDPTLHPDIVVLGSLTDLGKLKLVDAEGEEVIESEGKGAL